MKLNGFVGKGTGKLGASVFAISGGEQIVRQYNPKVSNPNTDAQVEQRAKLKLMSQVAADMAQSIAFPKKGLVSSRNAFISANIGKCTYNEGQAEIDLQVIELAGGAGNLPVPAVGEEDAIALSAAAPADVNAVVYAAYQRGDDQQLTLIDQKIVSEAGDGNNFPTTMTMPNSSYVVYVYGIKNNGKASVIEYMDYIAVVSNARAELEAVRSIVVKGGSLTATSALMHGSH